MIISCEYCQAKFKVADDAIGEYGRAVRCSNCNHQWIAKPSSHESTIAAKNYNNDVNHLIAAKPFYEKNSYRYINYFLCVISLLVLLITVIITNRDFLSEKAESFIPDNRFTHLYSNIDGLKIEFISCILKPVSAGHGLNAKVLVRNTLEKDKFLNAVRFTIFDANKNKIEEIIVEVNQIIAAGQTDTIEGQFDYITNTSKLISVELGNIPDFKIRDFNNFIDKITFD